MSRDRSIAVVGGGVIGLCCAYYAMKRGFRVVVLESSAEDHDGCSLGNAGMIVPSHFTPLASPGMLAYGLRTLTNPHGPFAIRPRIDIEMLRWGLLFAQMSKASTAANAEPILRDLSWASRAEYEAMAMDLGGDFSLSRNGLLMLLKSKSALEEEAVAAKRACALGIDAEVLTPSEASLIETGAAMDVAGAIYYPGDGHLSPQKLMSALTTKLKQDGAELHYSTAVTGWSGKQGVIDSVVTDKGEFNCDEYVVAAGSWSKKALRGLDIRLPLEPGKGYSMTLSKPKQMPKVCSILLEARVAVTPMDGKLRVGGTMEIGSLDRSINPSRVQGIIDSFPKYYPAFNTNDFAEEPVWSGLRPCSPDGLPYVGRFRKYKNLLAATGHAMMGVSLAPITGKLVSELISGERPSAPIDLLDPERFG